MQAAGRRYKARRQRDEERAGDERRAAHGAYSASGTATREGMAGSRGVYPPGHPPRAGGFDARARPVPVLQRRTIVDALQHG